MSSNQRPQRQPAIAAVAGEFAGHYPSAAELLAAFRMLVELAANAVPCDAERLGEFLVVRGRQWRLTEERVAWSFSFNGSRSGRLFCELEMTMPMPPPRRGVAEAARDLQRALNGCFSPEPADLEALWQCARCGESFAAREHWLEHEQRWHRRRRRG